MQLYGIVDGLRLLLFIVVIIILFVSTKQSSKAIRSAKRLPLIYPKAGEVSTERKSVLRALSRRWNLYTVVDFSLGFLLIYEFITGLSAANSGLQYYVTFHLPATVLISFGAGFLVSSIVIWFRSPFRSGTINPLGLLLDTLDTLVEAAKPEEGGGHGYVDSILLRVVAQEIERFMDNRDMGESERGKLLEFLSRREGVIGEVASSLLWPL
ncbi:MAG: hypothetical protein ACXAEE_01770 [Candidatus Thorarchaeota archaeon]